jgi:hypothetical protein
MRSRSLLFEDEPMPRQPRNTHLGRLRKVRAFGVEVFRFFGF